MKRVAVGGAVFVCVALGEKKEAEQKENHRKADQASLIDIAVYNNRRGGG